MPGTRPSAAATQHPAAAWLKMVIDNVEAAQYGCMQTKQCHGLCLFLPVYAAYPSALILPCLSPGSASASQDGGRLVDQIASAHSYHTASTTSSRKRKKKAGKKDG
eukprot:354596-Chlamydomonas_euryale.AAC.2